MEAPAAQGDVPSNAPEHLAVIAERMARIKHKLLVLSGKGGVGKSTVAAQLAFALAKQGKEVGLLDIDICGPSVPKMLGLEGEEIHQSNLGWSPVYVEDNLAVMSIGFMLPNPDEAVIWRGPRKNGLIKQFLKDVHWGDLDYLVVDAPPGTSDEHITIAQCLTTTPADGALIVTTPQEVAIIDVRKEISFCKKVGLRVLGVVENMSGLQADIAAFSVSAVPSGGGASNGGGDAAAVQAPVDVTSEVQALLAERYPGMALLFQTDVFKGAGGAQKMCSDMGVTLLGRVPLDPGLGQAAEEGRSVFEDGADGPAACLPALRGIVERIVELTNQQQ